MGNTPRKTNAAEVTHEAEEAANALLDEFFVMAYPGVYPEKEKIIKEQQEKEQNKRAAEAKQASQLSGTKSTETSPSRTPENKSFAGSVSSFFKLAGNPTGVLEAFGQVIQKK